MLNRVINWLKRSGTFDQDGKEMLDSLNPFEEVIVHSSYPFARIYQTNFARGISDLWKVLHGKHYLDEDELKNGSKGVLDILIFPVIGRELLKLANDNSKGVRSILEAVSGMVGTILVTSTTMLSIALTVALSPIVGLVHLFTFFKAKKLKEQIDTLEILPPDNNNVFSKRFDITTYSSCPYNIRMGNLSSEVSNGNLEIINVNSQAISTIPINEKNIKGINALLNTNTFNIIKTLEKQNKLEEVQTMLKKPEITREAIKNAFSSKPCDPRLFRLIHEYANCKEDNTNKNDTVSLRSSVVRPSS